MTITSDFTEIGESNQFVERSFEEKIAYLQEKAVKKIRVETRNPQGSATVVSYMLNGGKLPRKEVIAALRVAQGDEELALKQLMINHENKKRRFG